MASDLLSIGSSGLLAQQQMLSTTSNNISNVSTAGYTRQTTILTSSSTGLGVGDSYTKRLYDTYAQAQVWTDTSSYNESNTTYNVLSQLDTYLSDSTTGLSQSITDFFDSIESANSSPSSSTTRATLMSSLDSLMGSFSDVSTSLTEMRDSVNGNISSSVDDVNSILNSISDLNTQILKTPSDNDDGTRANLLDQRDQLITSLSEKLDIKTVAQDNGTVQINLISGESLVLPGATSAAQFSVVEGDPVAADTQLQLTLGKATTSLKESTIGGSIGGYFAARDKIEDTQRQVGQLSLSFSDAMNGQNELGMTLNNQLGSAIFTLPTTTGMAYSSNTGTASVTATVAAGSGSSLVSNDFQVENTSSGIKIYLLDGTTKTDVTPTGGVTAGTTVDLSDYGLSIDISTGMAVGDKFLIQPTMAAATNIDTAITSSDDFALASPITVTSDSANYGTGSITGLTITDTSSFSASALNTGTPSKIVMNSSGTFDIYDESGNSLGTSTSATNIFSSSNYSGTSPGYDFSISGTVQAGDTFTISWNTDGVSDNTNGLALAKLKDQDLVRKSAANDSTMTFSEAYNSTVSKVGSIVNNLKSTTDAAEAKLTQSQTAYESTSGVNLDEEAANLVRYQQAYAASAKVITAAKETFDTLLGAVG